MRGMTRPRTGRVNRREPPGRAVEGGNLNNKISYGEFSAVLLILCLEAMGCQILRLSED